MKRKVGKELEEGSKKRKEEKVTILRRQRRPSLCTGQKTTHDIEEL
jgi:hypothetical protein